MAIFSFDDFARTTFSAGTNKADGSPLSQHQIDGVIEYLKSPGSGADSTSSYAEFLDRKIQVNPPELARRVSVFVS